jgi:hypothetical protein
LYFLFPKVALFPENSGVLDNIRLWRPQTLPIELRMFSPVSRERAKLVQIMGRF